MRIRLIMTWIPRYPREMVLYTGHRSPCRFITSRPFQLPLFLASIRFLRTSLREGGSAPRPPALFALGQWHEQRGNRPVRRPAARVRVRSVFSRPYHGPFLS